MGYSYFPDDVELKSIKNIINFNNHSLVQFYHRNLAYLITIYIFLLGIYVYKKKLNNLLNLLNCLFIF